MVIPNIKRLAAMRKKLARLERSVEIELGRELAGLNTQFGFPDVESFLKAVQLAAAGPGRAPGAARRGKAKPARKSRKRAVITAAIRARVKALVKAGKPGSLIAKALGISLPSVQNIKKAAGLVKARGAKAPKKTPAAKAKPAKKAPARKAKKPARKPAAKAPAQKAAPAAAPQPAPAAAPAR